ncbi:autotransporter assembly complex protein TamA [Neisseriaceae bacterium TC5R-5]|nr:autotransporter assembly complex protein TamA [Neisseriaceae bacterium TC5R-5]
MKPRSAINLQYFHDSIPVSGRNFGTMAAHSLLNRIMPRSRLLFSLLFALFAAPAWAQLEYSVRIDAPSSISSILQTHLELITSREDEDMDQELLDDLVRGTPEEVQRLLETEGYFAARATVKSEGSHRFIVTVEPGEPVLIEDVTIRLKGPIRDEQDFQTRFAQVLEVWSLPIGAPYRQDDWDSSKRAVMRLVTADRFPTAKMTSSRADIDPQTRRANLLVDVDSGPLIRFGPISVKGLERYPENIVTGLADFSLGSPYRQQKLLDYQTAIQQSPHFSNVIVSTEMSRIDAEQRVPVEVEVTELPKQKLELGLTYDSSDGAGVRLGYDYYNLFQRGYTGSVVGSWNSTQQSLSLGLGFPRQADGYSHTITGSLKNDEIQGLQTRTANLGAWRIRTRGNIESRLGVEYLLDSQEAGEVLTRDSHALQMVFGWTQRAVDNLMRPRSGFLWDVQLSATPGSVLASTPYVRAYGRTVAYWTPFPKQGTFVGRLEMGQVWARDGNAVPSSILFRAGGINSVRGYEFQSLGLPGPNDSVLGGRVVATGSLEYQIPIVRPDWALALFTDAGNAADSWQSFSLARSYGVGVRWMSPVAPFSFDIAKAQEDGKIRWNLSLGLAF